MLSKTTWGGTSTRLALPCSHTFCLFASRGGWRTVILLLIAVEMQHLSVRNWACALDHSLCGRTVSEVAAGERRDGGNTVRECQSTMNRDGDLSSQLIITILLISPSEGLVARTKSVAMSPPSTYPPQVVLFMILLSLALIIPLTRPPCITRDRGNKEWAIKVEVVLWFIAGLGVPCWTRSCLRCVLWIKLHFIQVVSGKENRHMLSWILAYPWSWSTKKVYSDSLISLY